MIGRARWPGYPLRLGCPCGLTPVTSRAVDGPQGDGWAPAGPVTWRPASLPSRVVMSPPRRDVLWPALPAGSCGSSGPATPAASQTAHAVARKPPSVFAVSWHGQRPRAEAMQHGRRR